MITASNARDFQAESQIRIAMTHLIPVNASMGTERKVVNVLKTVVAKTLSLEMSGSFRADVTTTAPSTLIASQIVTATTTSTIVTVNMVITNHMAAALRSLVVEAVTTSAPTTLIGSHIGSATTTLTIVNVILVSLNGMAVAFINKLE